MKKNNNFSDTLISDYYLFTEDVYPGHDALQQSIADSLVGSFKNRVNNEKLQLLEIGTGLGYASKFVQKLLPQAHYTLNDFDQILLDESDNYLNPDCETIKQYGDIEQTILAIPDASIDGVYTAWVLHNFSPEKRKSIFAQVSRVLKPGGVFVYLEKIENPSPERVSHLANRIACFVPYIEKYNRPDLFIDWVKHQLRDEESDLLFTDDENEQLLTENGFKGECVKQILLEKVIVATKI